MEKVMLFGKNHWKKLSITLIPALYGINYIRNEYQIFWHMRYVCNEVKKYPISEANNVLVVLNPVANGKRCEKLFKKFCEPVLHMAGYSVEVKKTKHVGHAKSLMESLQKLPDVVVVAGGDGTSSEVVTGLLRRNKEICPILFLPLGEKSEIAFSLIQNGSKENTFEFVKYLSQCTLALVRGQIQHRSVIKYELVTNGKDNERNKPIFGIMGLSWGLLMDIEINKDKYWYFGVLKRTASVVIMFLNNKLNHNISANLVYTPPCPGCNKCEPFARKKTLFNFSKTIIPPQNINQTKAHKMCSTQNFFQFCGKQINVTCHRNSNLFFELNTTVIENLRTKSMFFENTNKMDNLTSLKSRSIELIPTLSENNDTYYIDGEGYDARPIKISFLPNKLKYLC